MKKLLPIFFSFFLVSLCAQQKDFARYQKISDSIYYSNPDSSFALAELVEKGMKDSANSALLAKAHVGKGRFFLLKSMLEESEFEFNKAYNIYRESKDTVGLGTVLKLKSILQERLGNTSEALFLLEESISMFKKVKNYRMAVSGLLNLMRRYISMGEFYKTEVTIHEIESLSQYMEPADFYFFNQNKGLFELEKKHYREAYELFVSALEIARREKMIDSEATILMYLAKASRLQGNIKQSIGYLQESEQLCEKHHLENEMLDNYTEYVFCYEAQGNYKEAFRYQQLKEKLSEKLLSLDKVNRIAALEKKLAVKEKQQEIDLQKVIAAEEQSKSRRLFYFLLFAAALMLLLIFLFVRTRRLKNRIQEKSDMIEEKQREILDSIHYAKRIQAALLTSDSYLKKHLKDYFILYKPKDIVSGDFYWAIQHEDKMYITVADCTGHGVPGAFMSMIGINLLSQIISERKCTNPALILDILREEIIRNLSTDDEKEETRDGMDMVLLKIDPVLKQIEFAGANNAVYIKTATGEMKEYKGNKMPVGRHAGLEDSFTRQVVTYMEGDTLYAFTDGYPDQFGGPKGKKFKYRQLEDLISRNSDLSMKEQEQKLSFVFQEWKGNLEQIDDVCVIGIRL